MLLTKSRSAFLGVGIILLVGLVLVMLTIAGGASADDAGGLGGFGDNTAAIDAGNEVGWDWMSVGTNARVSVYLDSDWAEAGNIFGIEVFVEPTTSTKPTLRDLRASALPTDRVLDFDFTVGQQLEPGDLGIHLIDHAGSDVLVSRTPRNQALLTPPPVPTATPAPSPTPVVVTTVPIGDITPVSAPQGGGAVIVQPDASATVSTSDGSVVVDVSITAYDTTFQLALDPSPDTVPAASPGTTVLRAFEVNAHAAGGAQVSLQLLKKLTVTAGYTAAEAAAAHQASLSNLRILSYSPVTGIWSPLHTNVDPVNQTLTARVGHLSLFAVGGVGPVVQAVETPVVAPTATPTAAPPPAPPPAGDIAPSPGLMLVLVLGGILMIAAGGTYFVQSRNVRT